VISMRILVTGGMGFIGSNFIRHVLEKGDCSIVTNLDGLKYGSNPANLADLEDDRYSFVEGDISDRALVSELVKDADAVVNFAAETHVDRSISAPQAFLQSNVVGVFTILEALRRENPDAKMIQISTDEVYGDILEGSFRETDAIRPSSPYSASKAAADAFVLGYARTYGLDAAITRCTNNYGPYQFPEKLIPKAIIRLARSLKVPIYGTGTNIRDWIYVLDHCKAVELVMKRGRAGEVYNISSGEERTNLEVVRGLLRIMGKDEAHIERVEDRPGHDLRYSLDSSKVRGLGWKPERGFEEGLRETVEWYSKNEEWWMPLADERTLSPAPWKLAW
jgi:dTDP-glucose 4,6-dehydratase